MASPAIFSNFFEEQWTQNHPQYLWGLSRALFPTTILERAVYQYNSTRFVKENEIIDFSIVSKRQHIQGNQVEINFFHESEAQAVDFFMFSAAKASESNYRNRKWEANEFEKVYLSTYDTWPVFK